MCLAVINIAEDVTNKACKLAEVNTQWAERLRRQEKGDDDNDGSGGAPTA